MPLEQFGVDVDTLDHQVLTILQQILSKDDIKLKLKLSNAFGSVIAKLREKPLAFLRECLSTVIMAAYVYSFTDQHLSIICSMFSGR